MKDKPKLPKRKTVHQALQLQSTYQIRVAVEGHIGTTHYRLRGLASQTGGTMTVYAKSESWSEWKEINQQEFRRLAGLIVNEARLPANVDWSWVPVGLAKVPA